MNHITDLSQILMGVTRENHGKKSKLNWSTFFGKTPGKANLEIYKYILRVYIYTIWFKGLKFKIKLPLKLRRGIDKNLRFYNIFQVDK